MSTPTARSIPLGTAYSVWVGIGAVGAFAFLALLIAAIIGLKATSGA